MDLNVISVYGSLGEERRAFLEKQLQNTGFNINFFLVERTAKGYDSAFAAIKAVVSHHLDADYFIFAEDDLVLTEHFTMEKFASFIRKGMYLNYDLITTGSWQGEGYKNFKDSLWDVTRIRGTQLLIIYKKMYQRIIDADDCNYFDDFLSFTYPSLKMGLTFPFLSKQRTDIPSMLVSGGVNLNYKFDEEEHKIAKMVMS